MPGYISEVDYDGGAGSNFVEVVLPAGTDVSAYSLVIYDKDGAIIETFSFDPPIQTIAGQDVYLFDDETANWVDIHNDEAIALVDDTGSVVQFISFKAPVTAVEGPANGDTSTAIGEHSGGEESIVTSNGGTSYGTTTTSTPGSVPCFGPGTLIATPDGPRAVETLRVGDLVLTDDKGARPIRWISKREISLDTEGEESGRPVLIPANALGEGLPENDLVLSANHRVLLGGKGQFDGLLAGEALAPAKALTGLPQIRLKRGCRKITWHHFALDRHAVVRAEGMRVESLLLGEMVLQRLSEFEQFRLRKMFPGRPAEVALNGPPARPLLTYQQAEKLLSIIEICDLFNQETSGAAQSVQATRLKVINGSV